MQSSTKFIITMVLWSCLCLPALLLFTFIWIDLMPRTDTFISVHDSKIAWILLGHLFVFFLPFMFALKYISNKRELIPFAIIGAIIIGLHAIARFFSISLSHFMCAGECRNSVIPMSVDQALTLILVVTFSFALITATVVRARRFSQKK